MTVQLTEKAEFKLRGLLRSSNTETNKAIRISVKDGGCNGYEYGLEITSKPQADDLITQQGNVTIYIDAKSAPLLTGVVIDFVEGVMDSGFKFTNPNATDTCGCGKSFKTGDCSSNGVPCS
ncbi:iron-sulfur cluster assembly accessory protein [Anabaena sp. FACHB-1237]|uniref:iron-sulfur cluster assembly accessory protein n=1 Tax=Anabaena sp. FACHB-1237 TaxID=2692769 RepID=UPI001681659B|nr:iron-sulfur cluster assembly accessory protein [Anabaena sp. FACHB-1237]MBD2137925.1 iron-sulfur cluster assembly accessory protein [Anabaena sp. FACHB-1237]